MAKTQYTIPAILFATLAMLAFTATLLEAYFFIQPVTATFGYAPPVAHPAATFPENERPVATIPDARDLAEHPRFSTSEAPRVTPRVKSTGLAIAAPATLSAPALVGFSTPGRTDLAHAAESPINPRQAGNFLRMTGPLGSFLVSVERAGNQSGEGNLDLVIEPDLEAGNASAREQTPRSGAQSPGASVLGPQGDRLSRWGLTYEEELFRTRWGWDAHDMASKEAWLAANTDSHDQP